MALRTLLYRYFFFGWLFRDASTGTALERAAAWRHNRSQARWLPTYMRRWMCCGLLLYLMGVLVESVFSAPLLSTLFYVTGLMSVPGNAVMAVAWIGFKALSGPF
ncbi:hypothetical protein [Azohydromonas caseinilytica]|uniref:Uncharacterized protein n=1 Tax=Azohydromonas caseinilytica TaxID=2728836 RepID=A0A848FDK0_9BURK|nr:hypothetical protein [Azohydromonas caseinilytica]NML17458.1 hypothetical protein [Azohydromonas caseinilytica]